MEFEKISEEVIEKHCQVMLLLLKKIAQEKGLSDQEIADRIGFQRGNVNRMLNGRYLPTMKNCVKIAHAIGVRFLFEDKAGISDLAKAFDELEGKAG